MRQTEEKKERRSKKRTSEAARKRIAVVLGIFLLAAVWMAPAYARAESLSVEFLDVGQGSAVLLESEGHYVLIDGGDRQTSSFVVSYLQNKGIDTFDYVVASHYDSDHLAGLIGVLHQFGVNQLLTPDYVSETKLYQSFCETASEYGISQIHPLQEERYPFGTAVMEVVGPIYYGHSDENEDSLCIRIENGETSFLICGDIGEDAETELVHTGADLRADVYLANHHGSDSSNTQEFLDAVQPSYAVISCGEGNSYGHPGGETMERFAALGILVYRTDRQGTIRVQSDGVNLFWEQEPCSDLTPGTANQNAGSEDGGQSGQTSYVLNTNSMKFHFPSCSAAQRIKPENRAEYTGTRESLTAQGYSPCGICSP